jgi:hypothetical protein
MENWDEFDGAMALKGADPGAWPVGRLVNAIESQIFASAEDDKERRKLRRSIYDPPKGLKTAPAASKTAPARGIRAGSVNDLLAQMAAEDDRWGSG